MTAGRFVLASLLGLTAQAADAQRAARRVILFIGDGVGASYWTAAKFAADALAVARFRVTGLVDTRSSDSYVTDSGASATAYATGLRTFNGAIGVGPDSASVPTVLEAARDRGMATGLVATSSVTHATPASFAAHVPSRTMEFEIARQLLASRVDVLLGGGRHWFDPRARSDSADLLSRLRAEYTYVSTAEELAGINSGATRRLAGLFALNQMPAAPERAPTLPAMTTAALEILDRDPDGFFLMVEGSQPDWRGHANEPLEAVTAEMLDFDAAIGAALEYQRRRPETLIVVTADHETGGLAIQLSRDSTTLAAAAQSLADARTRLVQSRHLLPTQDREGVARTVATLDSAGRSLRLQALARRESAGLQAAYTTFSHTAQLVPLFASGPGAERFGGILEIARVGQLLLETVRRER